MSAELESKLGKQIYDTLLPELYRNRDNARWGEGGSVEELGDLARYLDACGILLDQFRDILDQRLSDAFADNPEDGEACQEWLIPYIAQLVNARLVSPEAEGRRDEVAHAVEWRQRKGTLRCIEEIAEAVGQMEVEIQEGWKRVAHTARINMPLLPLAAYDYSGSLDMSHPLQAVDHPGLQTVTVDVRKPSRAMKTGSDSPVSHRTKFRGAEHIWKQLHKSGAPCYPESYEDVSQRTVDIRTPDWKQGHYHPKRVLLFTPPPDGLFPPPIIYKKWEHEWDNYVKVDGSIIEKRSNHPVEIINPVDILEDECHCIKNLRFAQTLKISKGRVELQGVVAKELVVDIPFDVANPETPVLIAKDCLFESVRVENGAAKFDSCTILLEAFCLSVVAENSIFSGSLTRPDGGGAPLSGEITHCRVPDGFSVSDPSSSLELDEQSITRDTPEFFDNVFSNVTIDIETESGTIISGKRLVHTGTAVLKPDCPKSIYAGGSDKKELGYFHHGRKDEAERISDDQTFDCPDDGGYPLEDIIFEGDVTINNGMLKLVRSAINRLTMNADLLRDSKGVVVPSLNASDCVFENLDTNGLTRLEYCTVMQSANCKYLQASDSIFVEEISGISEPPLSDPPESKPEFINCIRYSRLPDELVSDVDDIESVLHLRQGRTNSNTRAAPIFHHFSYCQPHNHHRPARFGEAGYGVLHPVTSISIRFGAEDHGEMGAYHHKHYALRDEGIIDKLADYMPIGIEPVLIPDIRLLRTPIKERSSEMKAETTSAYGEGS